MPKARKYKIRTQTTTNPLFRDEAHMRAHEKVLPVVQSLKSANEKDRKWSSAIIAELVQDDTVRLTLLREGVVNALLDRLTDDNVEVKQDALRSIDALVLKEGQSLCKELYRKNILVLLEAVLVKIDETGPAKQGRPVGKTPSLKFLHSLIESTYELLNHICEEYEEASEKAAQTTLLSHSFNILYTGNAPVLLKISVAQFIRILTSDSPENIRHILSKLYPEGNLETYATLIYRHEQPKGDKEDDEEATNRLRLILGGNLANPIKLIQEIVLNLCDAYLPEQVVPPQEVKAITQHAKNMFASQFVSSNTNDTLSDDLISCLRTLSSVATYLDTYLEINPHTIPPENPDEMDEDPDPFEEEMDIDDNLTPIDPDLLINLFDAIPTILQQQLSIPAIPSALETINDISWTMTLRIPHWEKWHAVAIAFTEFAVPRLEGMIPLGEETLCTFLGCIWATAKSLPEAFDLEADEIQLLENIYEKYATAELQAKIVGILGVAAQTESIDKNKYITAFLMKEITSRSPVVLVEIMDILMEIFADGEKAYDHPVFVEGHLLPKIKQMLPQLKKRIKGIDANKESEVRERADDVLENFVRFLKYKEEEARQ